MVELKPEGMAFARTLIPWDEMVDVRRGEGEDSLFFVGYVLSVEVPDLGSAIDSWVSYIEAQGASVAVFSRTRRVLLAVTDWRRPRWALRRPPHRSTKVAS